MNNVMLHRVLCTKSAVLSTRTFMKPMLVADLQLTSVEQRQK